MNREIKPLNILFVSPGFPCEKSGSQAAKFVYFEALACSINGAKVKVITPHYQGVPEYEKLNDNLEVYRFRYFISERFEKLVDPLMSVYDKKPVWTYFFLPFFLCSYCFAILKYAKWANIIHCQWTPTVLLALPAKLFFNKKIVVTARGSDIRLLPVFLNRFIFKSVNAAVDCYGPQKWNNDNKRAFRANYIQLPLIIAEIHKYPLPSDMQEAISDKQDCFKIIYLGRFDDVKLHYSELPILNLIEAASQLKIKNHNFMIFYIGDGEVGLKNKMKKMVDEKLLADHVHFLGFKANVNEYICQANLGIGGIALNTVCQEFSAYLIPQVIVNNHENIESVWIDKVNALFIKPNDCKSLVETIEYAINNQNELRKIAENAHIITSQYTNEPSQGGKKFISVYNQILENKIE